MPASAPSADTEAQRLLALARASRDDLEARLLLAAAVQRVATGIGVRTVVVGGTSVDFYVAGAAGTSAGYPAKWRASGDVDLIAIAVTGFHSMQPLKEALAGQLGFVPLWARHDAAGNPGWSRGLDVPDFPYGLEIVSDQMQGEQADRVFLVEVEGETLHLRGPEDTVISYAESGWHLGDARDWERALAVWRTMQDHMDLAYLDVRAQERRVPGVLQLVKDQAPLQPDNKPMF